MKHRLFLTYTYSIAELHNQRCDCQCSRMNDGHEGTNFGLIELHIETIDHLIFETFSLKIIPMNSTMKSCSRLDIAYNYQCHYDWTEKNAYKNVSVRSIGILRYLERYLSGLVSTAKHNFFEFYWSLICFYLGMLSLYWEQSVVDISDFIHRYFMLTYYAVDDK